MPIYEYKCQRCGVVEATQKITDAPLKRCPNCHSKVKKLVSLNTFHLKGSGWYATDYAKKTGKDGDKKKDSDKKKEEKPDKPPKPKKQDEAKGSISS